MNTLKTRENLPLPSFLFKPEVEEASYFEIDSEAKATWAAQKVFRAEHRCEQRKALAKVYTDRITQWLEAANKADLQLIEDFKNRLGYWISGVLKPQSRTRSIKLLGAVVGLRKQPAKLEILNPEEAIQYCERTYPQVIVHKKELSKELLKPLMNRGISIPGVLLQPGKDTLQLKEENYETTDRLEPREGEVNHERIE